MENTSTIPQIIEVVGIAILLEHWLIANIACVLFLVLLIPHFLNCIIFSLEHLSQQLIRNALFL